MTEIGDGTFSTNKFVPRFKLENHIKELELYNKIKEFLNLGNLRLTSQRTDRVNCSPLVVLEVNKRTYRSINSINVW